MRTLSGWFKALSEEIRLQIMALMFRHGELCGCELERFLEVSQSTVSRHLRYLLNAGLVEDAREGLWVYYRIAHPTDDGRRALLDSLRVLLADLPLPDFEKDLAAMRAERCGPRAAPAPLPRRASRATLPKVVPGPQKAGHEPREAGS